MKRYPEAIVTVHCPGCDRVVAWIFQAGPDHADRILSYGICDRCMTPYRVEGDDVLAAAKRYRTLLKRQAIHAIAEGRTPDAETARRRRPILIQPDEDINAVMERVNRRNAHHPPASTGDHVS